MPVKYFSNMELDKGINTQHPSTRVVWSIGRNVRFSPGFVYRSPGKSLLATVTSSFPIRDMFTFVGSDGLERTIVCCDTLIYAYNEDFSSYSDITPSPAPTGSILDKWQFALVAGLPILTNGKDPIWKWASYASALTILSGAPTFAKRISSCVHRLVASNISEDGNAYTGRIRWTEMGNPENWVIDMTNKSGRFDLMQYETGEAAYLNIKAQIADGSKMYFFTERGLWHTDFAQETKGFFIAGREAEIIGPKAVCRREGMIYWIGKQDLYSAVGGSVKPIGLPIRNNLFENVNQASIAVSYAFHNRTKREIWFCVPTGTNTVIDTAYIYNYELDLWSIGDVDFLSHSESDYTWLPYDIVGNQNGEILRLDDGDNDYFAGAYVPVEGTIETGDMHLGNSDLVKRISDVLVEADLQEEVSEMMVRVGVRNRLSDDIRWSDPVPFTLGVSERCDFNHFRKDGKYVRVRFYSDQLNSPWKLSGYAIKYELGGTR